MMRRNPDLEARLEHAKRELARGTPTERLCGTLRCLPHSDELARVCLTDPRTMRPMVYTSSLSLPGGVTVQLYVPGGALSVLLLQQFANGDCLSLTGMAMNAALVPAQRARPVSAFYATGIDRLIR